MPCLGDKACVLPPNDTGYCRHHALMLGEETARHFASKGVRGLPETDRAADREREARATYAREKRKLPTN